jgi:hypothetical protein
MQVYQGHVSRMTQTGEISGDGHGVSTTHIITCLVDGKSVEISMPSPPVIHPGDEIVVAGTIKRGTLKARAYNNLSNGSNGRWNYWIIDTAVTVGALGFLAGMAFPPALVLIPPYAIWVIVTGPVRTFRAYRKVKWCKTPAADEAPVEEEIKFKIEQEERRVPSPAAKRAAVTAPPVDESKISIACPRCGKKLKISAGQVGKKVKCPRTDCAAVIDTSRLAV